MFNNLIDPKVSECLKSSYYKFKHSNYLQELFVTKPERAKQFVVQDLGFYCDYSKNWIDKESLDLLFELADKASLKQKIDAMFRGEHLNTTEDRAALHTALRGGKKNNNYVYINSNYKNIFDDVNNTQNKIKLLCEDLDSSKLFGYSGKPIDTIVNIGIGGSDLGPKMVYYALKPYWNKNIQCHFVSNIDPCEINGVLEQCNPEKTLFIISSKSFTTSETLANANAARNWLLKYCNENQLKYHFIAVSSAIDNAQQFGIDQQNIFPMWDWVGGRFSLWSAIGLIIALGTSYQVYSELLAGAHDLDEHFRTKPWSENIPVILALLGIGYINFADAISHSLLPYSQNLEYFPSYIQQLDMESNGKSVDINSNNIEYKTGPIIWGAPGTNGQHAFHQLLHQGTHVVPCDFIVPINSHTQNKDQHQALVANALAQSRTLLVGTDGDEKNSHKIIKGNKPSTIILFDKLTPYNLGVLIAIYEHKVFTQGVIWGINSFDQWGVERGKVIAKDIIEYLENYNSDNNITKNNNLFDSSTFSLLKVYGHMKD